MQIAITFPIKGQTEYLLSFSSIVDDLQVNSLLWTLFGRKAAAAAGKASVSPLPFQAEGRRSAGPPRTLSPRKGLWPFLPPFGRPALPLVLAAHCVFQPG